MLEIKFRQRQAEEVERKRNLQGGVWAFGAGYCGQLGIFSEVVHVL